MPEVTVIIGERSFTVACTAGEESQLEACSVKLNAEANVLVAHSGKMQESQMLLMSGLMLADRAISLEEKLKVAKAEIKNLRNDLEKIPNEIKSLRNKVQVNNVSEELLTSLSELTVNAEAAADNLEKKLARPIT